MKILLPLLMLATTLCLGQNKFRDGYIISNEKDTIRGLINYREGNSSSRVCEFKSGSSATATKFTPVDILGYGFVNDAYFQSINITKRGQLPEVAFVEVLVKGLITLLKFDGVFFVQKTGGEIRQLINEEKIIEIDGRRLAKPSNEHIATLSILMFDCTDLRSKIPETKLSERSLTNLAEAYNRCSMSASVSYKSSKPWVKIQPGIFAAINRSSIKFDTKNSGLNYLVGAFNSPASPLIGVSADVSSPRLTEHVSLHVEAQYLKSAFYNFQFIDIGAESKRNYVSISVTQFKIPVGLKYTLTPGRITPYFAAGGTFTMHLDSHSEWIQEYQQSNGVVHTFQAEATDFAAGQLGLWGSVGVSKSVHRKMKAFFEIRLEKTNGISPSFLTYRSAVTNFQITIGITGK